MEEEDDSLELLLVKVTNPLVQPSIESLEAICQQLEKENDGPQISLRFLAHKIQSPQEREAMLAIYVLEEIIKRAGTKFHNEVGKFRFLNELIKVVSPKYMGSKASPKVKKKIVELMFKLTVELKQESKIFDAYQMLKRQGVVTEDPVEVLEKYVPPVPPPPRQKDTIFEDEEKSKLLQRLLQSRNPSDLQAANQLIKSMVHEADKRMEQIARRANELETVHNNAKVLTDMLNNYKPGETSDEEKELMKELYESCERLRPKLFKLAREIDEKEEGFDDLLKANDELTVIISQYKKIFSVTNDDKMNGEATKSELSLMDLSSPTQETVPDSYSDSRLLDEELLALGLHENSSIGSLSNSADAVEENLITSQTDLKKVFSSIASVAGDCQNISNTDNTSTLLGNIPTENHFPYTITPSLSTNVPSIAPVIPILPVSRINAVENKFSEMNSLSFGCILPKDSSTVTQKVLSVATIPTTSSLCEEKSLACSSKDAGKISASKALEDLDALGQSLLKQSLPPNVPSKSEFSSTPQKIPMSKLQKQENSHTATPFSSKLTSSQANNDTQSNGLALEVPKDSPSTSPSHDASLKEITVPLNTIIPGIMAPVTLHERNGVTVVVHFGKDSPRPDISVMVVSTLSQNANPVKKFSFHAAVPKNIKIKLQPPSATDLPSYNPILPPAAITQVMLISNPNKEKVRLKYKITYTINEEIYTDINEVDNLFGSR